MVWQAVVAALKPLVSYGANRINESMAASDAKRSETGQSKNLPRSMTKDEYKRLAREARSRHEPPAK